MSEPLKFAKGGGSSKSPVRTPDTLISTDTVEVLLGISEGPIKGLKDGAKSFRADDTPLLNSNGEANFQNFGLDVWPGSELGHVVTLDLGGFSSPVNINVTLAKNVPVVRSGFVKGINAADFRIVVQQLTRSNDKGTFTANLSLKFEVKRKTDATWLPAWIADTGNVGGGGGAVGGGGGTGGIGGGGGGGFDVNQQNLQFFNEPIDNGDHLSWRGYGAVNDVLTFAGDTQTVTVTGTGAPTAPPVDPTIPAVAVDDDDGVYHWRSDTSSWEPETPPPASGGYITLADGRRLYKTLKDAPSGARPGDLWVRLFLIRVLLVWNGAAWVKGSEYQAQTPPTFTSGIWTIDEKVSAATPKDIRVFLPNPGENDEWEYRVTKLSDDSGTEYFSVVAWESVQEINRNPMLIEGVAMARVIGRASDQFTSLPQWNGDWDGRIVKVPSNYDPVARTYTGIWDGTYKLAFTNNTAFIFQDFVENTRYGLSSVYPHLCNKWSIYNWGRHCDVMVLRPDGVSYRPRWTYNDYVQEPRNAKEMAEYIAGSAGAKYVDDGNGLVDVIVDMDTPAVAIFTPENIGEDGFNYSYTDRLTRANEVTVEFVNPSLNWNKDKRLVPMNDDIAVYGRIPENFIAVACTDVDEAMARARRRLIGGLTEKEIVSFVTNRKGKFLSEWDVILVADPDMGRAVTGRLRAVTGPRSATLRDPLTFDPGIEYWATFDVVNPDYPTTSTAPYRTERRLIANEPGAGQTSLSFAADLPDLPEYAVFAIEADGLTGYPKPYRITSIDDDSGTGDVLTITALELNRNKWSFIDTGVDQGEIVYTEFGKGEVLPPVSPGVVITTRPKGLTSVRVLTLSWLKSPSQWVRSYKIFHAINGVPAGTYDTTALQVEIEGVDIGTHTFSLIAVDIRGRESKPLTLMYNVSGEARPVAAPSDLRLVGGLTLTSFDDISPRVAWTAPTPDPLFSHFQVTVSDTSSGLLLRSEDVGQVVEWVYDFVQHRADTSGNPSRDLTFSIAAIDRDGNSSAPISLSVTNPAPAIPDMTITATAGGVNVVLIPSSDRDVVGAKVQYGPTATDPFGTTVKGSQSSFFVPLSDYEEYTVRAAFYDAFSEFDLNWSTPETVVKELIGAGEIDTTPPGMPTGLGLTSSTTIDALGQSVTRLVATWVANTETDMGDYEVELTKSGGFPVVEVAGSNRKEWIVEAGQTYSARVLAKDRVGNRSAYTAIVSHTTVKDTVAPGAPTGVSAIGIFASVGLSWTAPSALDTVAVQVFANTTNNSGTASLVTTVPARPGVVGTYVHDVGVNETRFYWLKAVDTSGNASVFSSGVTAATKQIGAGDVVLGSLNALHIGVGTLTGDRFMAGTITTLQLASKSVTASILNVGDTSNIYPDPDMSDPTLWSTTNGATFSLNNSGAAIGSTKLLQIAAKATDQAVYGPLFNVEPNTPYFLSARAYNAGADPAATLHIGVAWYYMDGNGNYTQLSSNYVVNPTTSASSTPQTQIITTPATARRGQFYYVRGGGGTQVSRFAEPIVRRANSGQMTVDGTLTANHIQFGSLTGDRFMANTIEGIHVKTNTLLTSHLIVGATAENLVVNGSGKEGNAGWNLHEGSSTGVTLVGQAGFFDPGRYGFWITKPATSTQTGWSSRAFPVTPGKKYSVKVGVGGSSATATGLYIRIVTAAARPPNDQMTVANRDNFASIVNNGPVTGGVLTQYEYVFTAAPGIYWAAFGIYNWANGPLQLYFTDVEVKEQVTGVSIADGAVTAAKVFTTSLSALSANLGSITAGQMNIGNRFIVNADGTCIIRSATTGQRTEIDQNGGRVYDSAGTLRVRWGIW